MCCSGAWKGVSELTRAAEGEDGNDMSRASSVSAKDRSNMAKRKTHKQRRDDSESFDSRSQYVVMSNGPQQSWAPAAPQYYAAPAAASYNGQYQQPYASGVAVAPGYGPNQGYEGYGQMMPNGGYPPPYNGMVPVWLPRALSWTRDLIDASVPGPATSTKRATPVATLSAP